MAESFTPDGKKRLKNYIREQIRNGHHVSEIRKHLVDYGHSEREAELLFDEILERDEQRKRRTIQRVFEILFVVLFFIFVIWVSATSQSPGEAIFLGFLPTI